MHQFSTSLILIPRHAPGLTPFGYPSPLFFGQQKIPKLRAAFVDSEFMSMVGAQVFSRAFLSVDDLPPMEWPDGVDPLLIVIGETRGEIKVLSHHTIPVTVLHPCKRGEPLALEIDGYFYVPEALQSEIINDKALSSHDYFDVRHWLEKMGSPI